MQKVNTKKTGNFTIVDNSYLRDENLSFKAKGILTYFLSLPGDWVIYFEEVITHSKDGIKSSRSGVDELIKEGYVRRYPIREDGVIVRWETEVYEQKRPLGQKVEVEGEEVDKLEESKASLLSTNKQRTNRSKDLNNISYYDLITEAWNSLGEMVFPIENLTADVKWTVKTRMLIDEYGIDELLKMIKALKDNSFAKRYTISFDWFLDDKNFNKLLAS